MSEHFSIKHTLVPFISLFTSAGTLVCCALPTLMVSLGMGAALAGMMTDFPQLVWLSQHKLGVFGTAAVMITFAGLMIYKARNLPCPADPKQAKACKRLRVISLWIYGFSVLAFATGFFFAFIAPYVLEK
ncbi:MAG: hypothetical protein H6867_06500 [Rhodospirillales bacterium]|nr:hypothetical protein [Rhodospirillales bacterium]MCB9995199.1 hypothetical protein [Rhodospirillales bacterium]